MPMPYSHYVVAQAIARRAALPIDNLSDYYVGAFYPDVRYFTKEPREKYHFPIQTLDKLTTHTGSAPDFTLGYRVHLLIDEVWEEPEVARAYKHAFPRLIRSRMTRGLQALAFELHCLRLPVKIVDLQPTDNDLIGSLGVERSQTENAVTTMQHYLDEHNLEAALEMAKQTELFPEVRLRLVEGIVSRLKNPVFRMPTNAVVTRASKPTFERVVTSVVERLGTSLQN